MPKDILTLHCRRGTITFFCTPATGMMSGQVLPGYRNMADAVVVFHLLFVAFAVAGGLLVLRWRWVAWLHIPVAAWATAIEFIGGICPLTPLENWLRVREGGPAYSSDFIARYVLPLLYPGELTREMQIGFGTIVLLLNVGIYGWVLHRQYRSRHKEA